MEDLPLEINKLISKSLDNRNQRHLRLASTKWFNIVDYNNFTIYLTKKSEWKQLVDRFEKYQRPISLTLRKNIMKELSDVFEHLTRLTNLTSFDFTEMDATNFSDWDKLTCFSNLKVLPRSFDTPRYHVWKKLSKLEFLVCESHDFTSEDQLADLISSLTDLRSLSIQSDQSIDNPFKGITFAHSKLARIEMSYDSVTDGWTDEDLQRLRHLTTLQISADMLVPKILSLKHLTVLESLSSSIPISDVEYSSKLTWLSRRELIEDEKRNFVHLQHLKGLDCMLEENTDYLTSLTSLETITIYAVRLPDNYDDYSILGSLASTRLTYMDICVNEYILDTSYFSRLGSIQELHLTQAIYDSNLLYLERLTRLDSCFFSITIYDRIPFFGQAFQPFLELMPQMTTLRHLSYKPNKIGDVPVDLSPLTNLEYLSIDILSASYSGFEHLTRLTSIHFDGYRRSPFMNFSYLANLTNLREFRCIMEGNAIKYIGRLTKLLKLTFHGITHDDDLKSLAELTKLTCLHVCNPPDHVTGEYLTHLTALQYLGWDGLNPDFVQHMPNLVDVSID